VIRKIIKAVGDELPGAMAAASADLDTIERYIDDGVSFVVIGTAAVKNPGFLHDACGAFAGHVIVALDAKGGKVATDGWSKLTGHDVTDLAKKFEDYGRRGDPLHRHRARRHDVRGQPRKRRSSSRAHVKIPVIASGGIASMKDIEQLCRGRVRGASKARSSAARCTKARSTSGRPRSARTNCGA